jgi:hypothetical protein
MENLLESTKKIWTDLDYLLQFQIFASVNCENFNKTIRHRHFMSKYLNDYHVPMAYINTPFVHLKCNKIMLNLRFISVTRVGNITIIIMKLYRPKFFRCKFKFISDTNVHMCTPNLCEMKFALILFEIAQFKCMESSMAFMYKGIVQIVRW